MEIDKKKEFSNRLELLIFYLNKKSQKACL